MIYGGDIMSNFSGSIMSNDKEMQKDILLSEIHKILARNPQVLIEALNKSGIPTKKNISKDALINQTVEALYSSKKFRDVISEVIVHGHSDIYSNADGALMGKIQGLFGGAGESGGEAVGGAVSGGGGGGDPVSAIAGAVGAIFGFAKSKSDEKNQKEADKAKLRLAILSDSTQKTNWMPIIIISGVLLIGGIVAYTSLKEK